MIRIFIIAFAALLVSTMSANAINLTDVGRPGAVIVVGADAIPSEKTAARELAKYLKAVTDLDFPLKNVPAAGRVSIHIGQTSAVKNLLPGFDWDSLKSDGILIKTVKDGIVLTGDRPRGTLYAVYTFLEKYIGCRFWAPDAEFIPQKSALSFDDIYLQYTPPLFYRETWFQKVMGQNPEFSAKMKLNGHFNLIPAEWGDSHFFVGWCHTMDAFIPANKYFADHPEWFSEISGKRVADMSQRCLTNEPMKKELIKNALEAISKRPNAAIVSISQNDYPSTYCQCQNCKATVQRYGGRQSGLLLEFVNSVAEEIEKVYPDIWVETLAYQYTRKAPLNIVPRKNVLIRLCTLECDFSQPLASPTNADFFEDLTAWAKIAPRLFIWNYSINFGEFHLPHPNINVLPINMRLFADSNVVGMFEQGDGFNQNVQLTPLRTYLAAKYLWDPYLDFKKHKKEFLDGYYGKAGEYLGAYIDLLQECVTRDKYYLKYHQRNTPYLHAGDYIEAFTLFNQAADAVADNPQHLTRVQTEKKSLELAFMLSPNDLQDEVYASGVIQRGDKNKWVDDFLAWTKATKNNTAGDGGVPMNLRYFRQRGFSIRNGPKPEAIANIPDTDWMDVQDDLFELAGEGVDVRRIEDNTASNNSAVQLIKGDIGSWAIQVPLFGPVNNGLTDVHIVVRMKMTADGNQLAVKAGLYDFSGGREIGKVELRADQLGEQYTDIYIGKYQINSGMKVYIAPMSNPDMKTVEVDRVYFYK